MKLLTLLFSCFLYMFSSSAQALPKASERGHFVDKACFDKGICLIPEATKNTLIQKLNHLNLEGKVTVSVIITADLDGLSLEQYAVETARLWKIGGKENKGLLIVLDLAGKKIRLEVGRQLEGLFTDAKSRILIENTFKNAQNYQNDLGASLIKIVDGISHELNVSQSSSQPLKQSPSSKQKISLLEFFFYFLTILICAFIAIELYSEKWHYSLGSILSGLISSIIYYGGHGGYGGYFVFFLIAILTWVLAELIHNKGKDESSLLDVSINLPSPHSSHDPNLLPNGIGDFGGGGASADLPDISTIELPDLQGFDISGCDIGGCDISF